LLTLLAMLVGCSAELPAPDAWTMQPRRGWNGESTSVAVLGAAFFPRVIVDARTGTTVVDDHFAIELLGPVGGTSRETWVLQDVRLRGYDRLDAEVPAGLDVGTYDLRVVSPSGGSDLLSEAFTVSSSRADHLRITSERVSLTVLETAWVEVEVLDPAGDVVLDDFSVVVQVSGDAGDPDAIRFVDGGLQDQAEDAPTAVRGGVGSDGVAVVGFTSTVPQTVTVSVRPLSTRSPDSAVLGDEMRVDFAHGSDLFTEFDLPSSPMRVVAGEPFTVGLRLVDQHGNAVTDASQTLLLRNECGPPLWTASVPLSGSSSVAVTLARATGTDACAEDHLVVAAGPSGRSAAIGVDAGPLDHFAVVAGPTSVRAGDPLGLKALVTPVDSFGNTADWAPVALTLQDSLDGLAEARCTLGLPTFCEATAQRAGEGLALIVQDGNGVFGESNRYDVVAGAPVALALDVPAQAVAGEPAAVALSAVDTFGNVVLTDALDLNLLALASDAELPQCVVAATQPDPRTWLDCTFTHAINSTTLTADYNGLQASSAPLDVVNGALALVEVVAPAQVTAGSWSALDLAGFDAWGNAYTVGSTASVALLWSGNFLGDAVWDGTGHAVADVQLTQAGTAPVQVLAVNQELGRSAPVTVLAGALEGLEVVAPPWAWLGVSTPVDVRAVDGWANTVAVDGPLIVGTTSGVATVSPTDANLVDGAARVALTWSALALDDQVQAAAVGLVGASAPMSAVQSCGVGGPTAALTFDGDAVGRACAQAPNHQAVILSSLSPSVAATGRTFALGIVQVGSASARRGLVGDVGSTTVSALGAYTVQGLVVQDDGCASLTQSTAWVGLDDGSAVGPVRVSPSQASIPANTGHTAVAISGAVTCRGTVAAGARVLVRSDRGAVHTTPGATGVGLAADLDGAGLAQAELDLSGVPAGGVATLTLGDALGTSFGEAAVLITGDGVAPRVWSQAPVGAASGTVSAVQLTFSEPLAPSSIAANHFEVRGPTPVTVTQVSLTGANTVTVQLSPPVKADLAVWTVWAGASITDRDGNALDGEGSGLPSDYLGTFGAVLSTAPAATSCGVSASRIVPDGDDGVGEQADTVRLDATASTAPSGWSFAAFDADGHIVAATRVRGGGASTSWTWDARDGEGAIVAPGSYRLIAQPVDSNGSRGASCEATVRVDGWG